MTVLRTTLLLAPIALLSACTIHHGAVPLSSPVPSGSTVCVIKNPEVREEFTTVLREQLERRELRMRELQVGADRQACPYTLIYAATWHWDLVSYMREARIDLYKGDLPAGSASYQAPHSLVNMTTESFEKTEIKIDRMLSNMGLR